MIEFSGEEPLIGESTAMCALRERIALIAPTRLPVLIEGPTGSGKELAALLLHRLSRRTGHMVAHNVASLSDAMLESALFGHTRGAFTGAVRDVNGLLHQAHGGSLFLDEVSSLDLSQQPKILRVLETRRYRPIGQANERSSDFRLMCATNENLDAAVRTGRFRADLLHRIAGVRLVLPPLRERLDDIPMLVRHFLRQSGRPDLNVPVAVSERLQMYSWPGNVRELRNVIEYFAIVAGAALSATLVDDYLADRGLSMGSEVLADQADARARLRCLLADAAWDIDSLAARLGVHRATLYRQMKRHGIRRPSTVDRFVEMRSLTEMMPSAETGMIG